jgi:hypothetical protein
MVSSMVFGKVLDKLRGTEGVVMFEDDAKPKPEKINLKYRLQSPDGKIFKDKNGWYIKCKKDGFKIYVSEADVDRILQLRVNYEKLVTMQNEAGKQYAENKMDGMGVIEYEHRLLYDTVEEHKTISASLSGSFSVFCDNCGAKYWMNVIIETEDPALIYDIPSALQAILEKGFRTEEAKMWVVRATGKTADEVVEHLRELEKTINGLNTKPKEIKAYLDNVKREIETDWFSLYIFEIQSTVTVKVHDLITELRQAQRSLIDTIWRTRFPEIKGGGYTLQDIHDTLAYAWLDAHGYSEEMRPHELTVKR